MRAAYSPRCRGTATPSPRYPAYKRNCLETDGERPHFGVVEPVFQTIAYSIHDRVWHRVERRKMLSRVEETAEAFTARLEVMDAHEQNRAHNHHGHSHALPRNLKQIALKTVTYGVMHFTVAVLVAFALTRDIRIALAIGTIEPLVQTVFFTLHDRIWTRLEARKAARRAAAEAESASA